MKSKNCTLLFKQVKNFNKSFMFFIKEYSLPAMLLYVRAGSACLPSGDRSVLLPAYTIKTENLVFTRSPR